MTDERGVAPSGRSSLVTGGAGFIGSHLAEELLRRGDEVHVVDDLSTGRFENVAHLSGNPRFHYVNGTILDDSVMSRLVERSDVVFHLAAAVGVRYVIENILRSLQINIRGTEVVLDAANRWKRKVVLFSSSEIYGRTNSGPFNEDHDRTFGPVTVSRWTYAAGKAIDEILALAYHREKRLPVVVIRCFNTCGPRQTGEYGMVVPRFVKQALVGAPLTVYGDGQQSRCFADVSDIVRGTLLLLERQEAEGDIFNLGSEVEISIEDLAKRIRTLAASDSRIEYIPYDQAYEPGFEDMRRRVPDIGKVRALTGYEPQVPLDQTLRGVIDYFKS